MKRKNVKRLLAAMFACSMLIGSVSGCGSSEPTQEAAAQTDGETESPKESTASAEESAVAQEETAEGFDAKAVAAGAKLTIVAPSNVTIEDYNTNETTLRIEEEFGVDLEFITYPSDDYADKLNILLMSGEELPDIIFATQSQLSLPQWISEGALLKLNDYYADPNFASNLMEANERVGLDIGYYLTQGDGGIYSLPSYNQNIAGEVYQKLWVYKPWLDELGLKVPETTEEFYEACKLIVENDMNGNGKADEIGLIGNGIDCWFDVLMTPYVYAHDSEFRVVEDGKISFAYTTEEWKEGLKYIKRFFDEGLIPEEVLTQNWNQYRENLFAEEQSAFSFAYYHYDGTDQERRAGYTYIPALEGPSGQKLAMYAPKLPSSGAVITTECENPDAAFLVCDYLCGAEQSIITRWGKKGEDWDYMEDARIENKDNYRALYDGYEISLYPYDDAAFWGGGKIQNASYKQIGPMVRDAGMEAGLPVLKTAETEEEELSIYNETHTAEAVLACLEYKPEEVFDYVALTAEETEKITDIKVTLNTYLTEMTSAFLVGNKDIDAEWDAFQAELEKIGCNTVLEVYQTAYDRLH